MEEAIENIKAMGITQDEEQIREVSQSCLLKPKEFVLKLLMFSRMYVLFVCIVCDDVLKMILTCSVLVLCGNFKFRF